MPRLSSAPARSPCRVQLEHARLAHPHDVRRLHVVDSYPPFTEVKESHLPDFPYLVFADFSGNRCVRYAPSLSPCRALSASRWIDWPPRR
jgi:hypothetical protein